MAWHPAPSLALLLSAFTAGALAVSSASGCAHPATSLPAFDDPYVDAYALAYADYRRFVGELHRGSRTARCLERARLNITVLEDDGGVDLVIAPLDGTCCTSFGLGGCGRLEERIAFAPDGGLRVKNRVATSTFGDDE